MALEGKEGQELPEGGDTSADDAGTEGAGNEGQGPSAEILSEATRMGWVPKDKWRGDPERWTDADAFVQRGNEILPILKANNRSLGEQLQQSRSELQELRDQHAELQDSVRALTEIQTRESAGRVDRQITATTRQIEEARQERDTDLVVELTEKLDALKEEKTKLAAPLAKEKKEPVQKENNSRVSPETQADLDSWQEDNSWFGQNKAKTMIAHTVADQLRRDPANKGLKGRAFLDAVSEATEEIYSSEFGDGGNKRPVNKNSGGSNSGNRSGNGSTTKGKSFNDLPAEAKKACSMDVDRVVGPNKVYKTEAEYQKYYAKEYFGDES